MCLLISQPKKTKQITREYLENADISNPDGMGLAYAVAGRLVVEKFRNFEPFYKAYKNAYKKHSRKTDFILHFRLSTHGSKNGVFNVHPFKVSDELVFAHNGMISNVQHDKKKSDTQVFNDTILKRLKPDFLKNNAILDLLAGFIGSDKLVFLNNRGKSTIVNADNGHVEKGVWYSNHSYETFACGYGSYMGTFDSYTNAPKTYGYGANIGKLKSRAKCEWCDQYAHLDEYSTQTNTGAEIKRLCQTCADYVEESTI